jgi:hypothetical protein
LLVSASQAQLTQPAKQLPPSLVKELRLRKGVAPRVVSFADTIKAKSILSRSLRDTVGRELDSASVSDSVVMTLDSAVSLSQKEILDSMLAELPEYSKTVSGVEFKYPPSILVQTNAKVVPFDSSLLAQMEPVVKEPTPYIDGFPTTVPFVPRHEPSIYFEAGVGYPTVPFGSLEANIVSSPLTHIAAGGNFANNMGTENAIKNTYGVSAKAKHLFIVDSLAPDARQPQMDLGISFASRNRDVKIDSSISSYSQSYFTPSLQFEIGEIDRSYLIAQLTFENYTDNTPHKASESSLELFADETLNFFKDTTSNFGIIGKLGFYSSRVNSDSISNDMNLILITPYYHSFGNSLFDYKIGLSLADMNYTLGDNQRVRPYVEIYKLLSENLLLKFTFDPKITYSGLAYQSRVNPFYSPGIISVPKKYDYTYLTVDKLNFTFLAEQYISSDDYLRATAKYITRYDEMVFRLDSASHFYTEPTSTRRFEVELGGNLRLFSSDGLAATVIFASTVSQDDEKQLPFVPQLSIQSAYTFGSLSELIKPKLEFIYTSRTDRSLAFINAEASYPLSEAASLSLRFENILGSDSDFWTGYTEYPRAIRASIKAAF